MLNLNKGIFHEIIIEVAVRRQNMNMHKLEYICHVNNCRQNFHDTFMRTMFGQKCAYVRISN